MHFQTRSLELKTIAGQYGLQNGQLHSKSPRIEGQGADIFGQTGAAEGKTGLQIGRRNVQLFVSTDQPHDRVTVNSKPVAYSADFIGESSLDCVEGIVGQFKKLCFFQRYAGNR